MNNENQTINLQDVEVEKARPMKWYKFLIYFGLWAAAVLYIIEGISTITGKQYLGAAGQVYEMFPGMKIADVGVGVAYIVLAVLVVVARFALAKYKASGPKLVVGYYIASFVVNIVYAVAASMALGQSIFTSNLIGSLIGCLVGAVVNAIYFNKRKNLFVN